MAFVRQGFTNPETDRNGNHEKGRKEGTEEPEDLFLDGLKDLYYAEEKILKALPKMAKGAESEEVTAAFEKHRAETEG